MVNLTVLLHTTPRTRPAIHELISTSLSFDQATRPETIREFRLKLNQVLDEIDHAHSIQKGFSPITKSLIREINDARKGKVLYSGLDNAWSFVNSLHRRHREWRELLKADFPACLRLPAGLEYLSGSGQYNDEVSEFNSQYTTCVDELQLCLKDLGTNDDAIKKALDETLVKFEQFLLRLLRLQHRLTSVIARLV
jgi:hypothetical protein